MTTVYILATDIRAAGLADGFAMPASVPEGAWCEGEWAFVDGRTYMYVVDANGYKFNVEVKPEQVKQAPGGEVVKFPGVELKI